MPRPRRLYARPAGVRPRRGPRVVAATPATAAATSVALVGDLQSELGCSADWQPECTASELARVGDTSEYRATFDVPAGDGTSRSRSTTRGTSTTGPAVR